MFQSYFTVIKPVTKIPFIELQFLLWKKPTHRIKSEPDLTSLKVASESTKRAWVTYATHIWVPPKTRCLSINRSKMGGFVLAKHSLSPSQQRFFRIYKFLHTYDRTICDRNPVCLPNTKPNNAENWCVLNGWFICSYSDDIYPVICLTVLCEQFISKITLIVGSNFNKS